MNAENGWFVWYEHMAKDPEAAIAFYTEVTGWTTQAYDPSGEYVMWVGSRGTLGGVMKMPGPQEAAGAPAHWVASVLVANVDQTAVRAKELGGTLVYEPFDIPTVGRYARIADPHGASLGVFTPPHGDGMGAPDPQRPGEFCWNELVTSDHRAALDFYGGLFGWKPLAAVEMGAIGTYQIYGTGEGKQLGGMLTMTDKPPSWIYYVATSDLPAAVARATHLGAKLTRGPADVPGGRIAQLVDPQGAAFALHAAL